MVSEKCRRLGKNKDAYFVVVRKRNLQKKRASSTNNSIMLPEKTDIIKGHDK